jgi:hypothetical protein
VSLIWHDEVMADVVVGATQKITLGSSGDPTFVVPALGLPETFEMFRPGKRGYVLTLAEQMRGRICVDGNVRSVEDFVKRGGEGEGAGDFRGTPIGGRDWGVVDLGPDGRCKVFFQFVEVGPPLPLSWFPDVGDMLPGLAFALILCAAFIYADYRFLENRDSPWVWPESADLTGEYLVTRLTPSPPPPPEPPSSKPRSAAEAAAKQADKPKAKSAARNSEGASGGLGEQRAKDPNAVDDVPTPPKAGFFEDRNRKMLDQTIQTNIQTSLNKFMAIPGERTAGGMGKGRGTGSGIGDVTDGTGGTRGSGGRGTGGGGSAEGEFVSQGKIDTGETRAPRGAGGSGSGVKEVAVISTGTASGDFGGLSKEEIDRVIRSRQGLIKACYQKELNRTRGLGGKLVIGFTIAADGVVKSTRVDAAKSSLRNDGVESCVRAQISKLKFPAKGGGVVNYPFIFSQGA